MHHVKLQRNGSRKMVLKGLRRGNIFYRGKHLGQAVNTSECTEPSLALDMDIEASKHTEGERTVPPL